MQCPKCAAPLNDGGVCEHCGLLVAAPHAFHDPAKQVHVAPAPLTYDYPPNLALVSDIGRHHPVNQDNGMVGRSASGNVVIVVADGVSSSDKADVASATAAAAAYEALLETGPDEPGPEAVQRAVAIAHAAVMEIPYSAGSRKEEPETTIVLALVRNGVATIAWVGDSRAYTVHPGYARLITRDDSWLADALEQGIMTPEQAMTDVRSHAITQCLGMLTDPIRIHVRTVKLDPDTWLLLCTDGLWNYFDKPALMAQTVNSAGDDADAFELCQYMVKLANQAGGHDNITIGAYRYTGPVGKK